MGTENKATVDLMEERPSWMLTEQEIADYFADFGSARILLTGSEDWTDRRSIAGALRRAVKYLKREPQNAVLIHGSSHGAERLAEPIARELGLSIEPHFPSWNDPNAEKIKRKKLLNSNAQILVAFIRDDSSEPTAMLKKWLRDDRPAIVCRQRGEGPVRGEFLNMNSD